MRAMFKAPPRLGNEAERIAALHASGVLDAPPPAEFQDIAREAARLAVAPIGLVSFIASDRQWIKAAVGAELAETARDAAFCSWTIHGAGIFSVEDALGDARFADNPMVLGAPFVRAYAGAPIVTPQNYALGAVCVIDPQPRRFAPSVGPALERLASRVSQLLSRPPAEKAA